MMPTIIFSAAAFSMALAVVYYINFEEPSKQNVQMDFIAQYDIPELVKADLKRRHPEWSDRLHALA